MLRPALVTAAVGAFVALVQLLPNEQSSHHCAATVVYSDVDDTLVCSAAQHGRLLIQMFAFSYSFQTRCSAGAGVDTQLPKVRQYADVDRRVEACTLALLSYHA